MGNTPEYTRAVGGVYHFSHSPYMLGTSPRMYASNVRFKTVDQSRSRLSSATRSSGNSVVLSVGAAWLASTCERAMRSPLMKRGPRSGQFRVASKGCHL